MMIKNYKKSSQEFRDSDLLLKIINKTSIAKNNNDKELFEDEKLEN